MVVTLPDSRTPEIGDVNDNDHIQHLEEEEDEGHGESDAEDVEVLLDDEEDNHDSDMELDNIPDDSSVDPEKSSTRARTHVITRSRSTSDLYVCDLEEEAVNATLDDVVVSEPEPDRVQSNPEQDSSGVILSSSTPSLKSLRDGRYTRQRSTLPLYYERSPSVSLKEDPYNNLLQTSAEKVLNKLKSRQLILSQEQLSYRRNSSVPQVLNSVPRKLKPLFSGEENKRTSVNEDRDIESQLSS